MRGRDNLGLQDQWINTSISKIVKQQGFTYSMEIFSTLVKTFIGNFDRDCTESIDGSGEHDRKRSTVVIKCYVLLDLNYYNFVKFFTFIFVMYIPIQLYCYVFSFFFFCYQVNVGLIKWFWKFFSEKNIFLYTWYHILNKITQ